MQEKSLYQLEKREVQGVTSAESQTTQARLSESLSQKYNREQRAAISGMVSAFWYYEQRLTSNKPLNKKDALNIQSLIGDKIQGTTVEKLKLGKFRYLQNEQVEVIGEPLIPPPPGEKLIGLINELFQELEKRYIQPTVEGAHRTAAWFHFMFAKIHPFMDFNGRTARLLTDLYLEHNGFEPVADWQGDLKSREGEETAMNLLAQPYLKAIEATERLRYNRWDEKFMGKIIKNYDGKTITLGEIGEDYLLPLECHMLMSGIKTEIRFYEFLKQEVGTEEYQKTQRKRISSMQNLFVTKLSKLASLVKQCPEAFNECLVVDWSIKHPKNPHGAPLWEKFISPSIK